MKNFFRKLKEMAGFKEGGIFHDYTVPTSNAEYFTGIQLDPDSFRILPSDPLPEQKLELAVDNQGLITGVTVINGDSVSAIHSSMFGKLPPVSDDEPRTSAPKGINPKDAIGATKVDLSVVPPAAELHMAAAMMDGAAKYGPFNWRENPVQCRVYVAAARRHLLQFLDGENFDPLSNVHHLGHAMACCAIILDAMETGNLADDRPIKGEAGNIIRRFTPEKKLS